MKNSFVFKIISSAIAFWLASLACNTIYHIPMSSEPTPINTPIPVIQISPKDGMQIIFVAAGEFIMGSDNDYENESPAHNVYLDDYWIDKTEVTNAMYYTCMQFGPCKDPLSDGFTAPSDHYKNPQTATRPITYITWFDAQTYCEWAGRRLPTEAEWEKAARGAYGKIYPWGDKAPTSELSNFDQNNFNLMPVGSFPSGTSPYNAMDMAGNAWELVMDWYDETYYQRSPSLNPTGPNEGTRRVMRGGAYFQPADEIRSAFRNHVSPDYNRSGDLGFRCASDAIDAPTTTSSR